MTTDCAGNSLNSAGTDFFMETSGSGQIQLGYVSAWKSGLQQRNKIAPVRRFTRHASEQKPVFTELTTHTKVPAPFWYEQLFVDNPGAPNFPDTKDCDVKNQKA